MNNEFDEELEELVELENYDSSSFNNNKNLKQEFLKNQIKTKTDQIRQQRNNVNHNQNATNRLKQRNANTLGKKVELRNSTSSNNEENNLDNNPEKQETKNQSLNPLDKLKSKRLSGTRKSIKKVEKSDEKIKKSLKKGIATGIKVLATNPMTAPFFWGGVVLVLIIMIIPIMWAAFDMSTTNSKTISGEGETGVCNYVLNGEEISNLKVRLLECGGNTPIPGEDIIDFDKYVLGVAYAENEGGPAEGIKAEAIAAKSYALRRPDAMGYVVGLKITEENGQKILNIRNCTSDQVYCDPDKGCWSDSRTAGRTVHSGYNSSKAWKKPPLAQESYIRQAVDEIKDKVLINDSNNIFYATYTSREQDRWNAQARQGKTYQEMLAETYPNAKVSTLTCTSSGNGSGSCKASLPVTISGTEIPISSPFGPRWGSFHRGVDIPVSTGTEIYSIFDGTVTLSGWYGTGGLAVIVTHDLDGDGTVDYTSRYYHMSQPIAKVGEKVTGGQLIGYSGNTGNSTGPHLHFGLETPSGYIDPLPVLKQIITNSSPFNNAKVCKKAANVESFPYYSQYDSRWANKKICDSADYTQGVCSTSSTISSSGCGYTSFAMIASGINNDKSINPSNVVDYVSKYSYNPSGGAVSDAALVNSSVLSKYNLNAEQLFPRDSSLSISEKKTKIKNALENGKSVILLVPDHFVALVGMKDNKIKLNDPSRSSNTGLHTIDEIFNIYKSQRASIIQQSKANYTDSDFFVMAIAYSKK